MNQGSIVHAGRVPEPPSRTEGERLMAEHGDDDGRGDRERGGSRRHREGRPTRTRRRPRGAPLDQVFDAIQGQMELHRGLRREFRVRRDTGREAHEPADAAESCRRGRRRSRPRREVTREERAYKEAQLAANGRIGFGVHVVAFFSTVLFLLVIAGFRTATVVALAWGIGLATHGFIALVAPRLRSRIIDREVSRRLQRDVSRERRSLEADQSRRVEELSASIAHEIRNPITAAKSLVQQLGEDPGASENVEYANVALEELERVERSISHLLRFAREEDIAMTEMLLRDVIDSAVETFRDRVSKNGVEIDVACADIGPMHGDPEQLRRVVINLLGNALDAFEEAGTEAPRIGIQAGENLAGNEVWVRVKDNGPGMEPERLTRTFSPFYTSKSRGTGLGLAISKKVVDAHGGSIEAKSDPGSGTEFVLTFPKPEPGART